MGWERVPEEDGGRDKILFKRISLSAGRLNYLDEGTEVDKMRDSKAG